MLEFEIKNMQLPVITVNFEEMKNAVAETMKKYTGIIVTEDSLSLCKATQRELAGMRNKVEEYRKGKKKELSKPIDEFEAQCKELVKLIENAEKPIKQGISVFDNKKREEKKDTALKIIKEVAEEHGLSEKYSKQLTVIDKYMNLTASIKDVREDVEQRAYLLKEQQIKEQEMLDIIIDTIENVNKTIKTPLSLSEFQNLIDMGMPTKSIIQRINQMGEKIRIAEMPKEEVKGPKNEVIEEPKQEISPQEKNLPAAEEEKYFIEIRIIGNKKETAQLGQYLRDNNYTYTVLNKGTVK